MIDERHATRQIALQQAIDLILKAQRCDERAADLLPPALAQSQLELTQAAEFHKRIAMIVGLHKEKTK